MVDKDALLCEFVHLVEQGEAPKGVTLMVGGTLVSGVIVPLGYYFEVLEREYPRNREGEGKGDADTDLSVIRQKKKREQEDMDNIKDPRDHEHIHLTQVNVLGPGLTGLVPGGGQSVDAWRCRISAVEGFWFGTMDTDSPG